MVAKLSAPRTVWIMVAAGYPTQETVEKLLSLLSEGDTIIDGGNSHYSESVARRAQCLEKGVHYVDVGTSGGVWGLEVGYCMMVGGEQEAVDRIAPVLDVLAPADGWARVGESARWDAIELAGHVVVFAKPPDQHRGRPSSRTDPCPRTRPQPRPARPSLASMGA